MVNNAVRIILELFGDGSQLASELEKTEQQLANLSAKQNARTEQTNTKIKNAELDNIQRARDRDALNTTIAARREAEATRQIRLANDLAEATRRQVTLEEQADKARLARQRVDTTLTGKVTSAGLTTDTAQEKLNNLQTQYNALIEKQKSLIAGLPAEVEKIFDNWVKADNAVKNQEANLLALTRQWSTNDRQIEALKTGIEHVDVVIGEVIPKWAEFNDEIKKSIRESGSLSEEVVKVMNAENVLKQKLNEAMQQRQIIESKQLTTAEALSLVENESARAATAYAEKSKQATESELTASSALVTVGKQIVSNLENQTTQQNIIERAQLRATSAAATYEEQLKIIELRQAGIAEATTRNKETQSLLTAQQKSSASEAVADEEKMVNSQGRLTTAIEKTIGNIRIWKDQLAAATAEGESKIGALTAKVEELKNKFNFGNAAGAIGGTIAGGLTGILGGLTGGIQGLFYGLQNLWANLQQGIGVIEQFGRSAADLNLQIIKFSASTGVSEKDAYGLVNALNLLGIDTGQVATGFGILNKKIAEGDPVFASMGVSVRGAGDQVRSINSVLLDMNASFQKLNPEQKTQAIANLDQSFGRWAKTLLPFLQMDLSKVNALLNGLKLNPDPNTQRNLNDLSASFQTLQAVAKALQLNIGAALAPAFKALANAITDLVQRHMDQIISFFNRISNAVVNLLATLHLLSSTDWVSGLEQALGIAADANQALAAAQDEVGASATTAAAGVGSLAEQTANLSKSIQLAQLALRELQQAETNALAPLKQQEADIKDALEATEAPLKDRLDLLNQTKHAWEEERDAALSAVNAEISALESENRHINAQIRNETFPLQEQLHALQQQQRHLKTSATLQGDSATSATDATADFAGQIRDMNNAEKAWENQQNTLIKQHQTVIDGLDDQTKAIKEAEAASKAAADEQIRLNDLQIASIQDVGKAAKRQSDEQDYLDKRAYLAGQSILAQLEARARALSDRQARERNQGETDTEYQLRIQQLNAGESITDQKTKDDLKALDDSHAITQANNAREDAIALIQAQSDAIKEQIRLLGVADDAQIAQISKQKDLEQSQIDAVKALIDAHKQANDAAVQALQDQESAIKSANSALRDGAHDTKSAADALQPAIDDLENRIQDIQDKYQATLDANNLALANLGDTAEDIKLKYDKILTPIDNEITHINDSISAYDNAAAKKIAAIDKVIHAIEKQYEPEIAAQETVINNLQLQKDKIDLLTEATDAAAQSQKDLNDAASKYKPAGDSPLGNFINNHIVDNFLSPYDKAKKAYEKNPQMDAGPEGIPTVVPFDQTPGAAALSKETPSFAEGLASSLLDTTDAIIPIVAKFIGKIFTALQDQVIDYTKTHPLESAEITAVIVSFMLGGPVVGIIALFIVGFIAKFNDQIKSFFSSAMDKTFGNTFVRWMLLGVPDILVESIIALLNTGLLQTIVGWLTDGSTISTVAKAIGSFFQNWFTTGELIFLGIPVWLTTTVLGKIVGWLAGNDTVRAFASGVEDFFQTFFDSGDSKFKDIAGWFKKTVLDPTISAFSELPDGIAGAIGGIFDKVVEVFKGVYNVIRSVWNPIANFIDGLTDFVGLGNPLHLLPAWEAPSKSSSNTTNEGGTVGAWRGGVFDGPTKLEVAEGGAREYVISTDPKLKPRSLGLVGGLLRDLGVGGPSFNPGAVVGKVGDVLGGIIPDWLKNLPGGALDLASSGVDFVKDIPSKVFDLALNQAIGVVQASISRSLKGLVGNSVLMQTFVKLGEKIVGAVPNAITGLWKKNDDQSSISDMSPMFPPGTSATQSYGVTQFAKDNPGLYAGDFHTGDDLANTRGTKLTAPGKMVLTGMDGSGGLGNHMTLTAKVAGQAYSIVLGHLDQMMGKIGDTFKKGDILGLMGMTGMTTGPHTHVEAWAGGARTDPAFMLPRWKSFWGSDLAKYSQGGMIRPNSTLIDAGGNPYAMAGEGGLAELVSPVSQIRNLAHRSFFSGLAASIPALAGTPHTNFSIGELNIHTQATSPEGIAEAVTKGIEDWTDKLTSVSHQATLRTVR